MPVSDNLPAVLPTTNPAHHVAQVLLDLLAREAFMLKALVEKFVPNELSHGAVLQDIRERLHPTWITPEDTVLLTMLSDQRRDWVLKTLQATGAPVSSHQLDEILSDPAVKEFTARS